MKIKNILKKILFLKNVQPRIERIEYHSINRRFYAIEQTAEYLIGAKIPGDYLEFGVYEGTTFAHAYKWMSPYFKKMRFIAFDSFKGYQSRKELMLNKDLLAIFMKISLLALKRNLKRILKKQE